MEQDTSPIDPGPEINSDEFEDYDGPIFPPGVGFDFSRLLTAESLRGIAAVVVATLVLRTPSRSPRSFAVLLGIILVVWAVGGLIELRDPAKRTKWGIVRVLLLAAFGVGLLLDFGYTGVRLGQAVGVALIVLSIFHALRGFRASDRESRLEPLLESLLYAALGVALVVSPLSVMGLAVLLVAVYWFLAGVATVVVNLRLDDRTIAPSNTWGMFLEWIQTRPNTADDRHQLYEKLFFEGENSARRLSRFFSLMGFATAIATFGVISDSTAVVIGAMLVAPLMTPLMGTSLGMTMGWPRRAFMSGGVALAGILFAVGLGILFGWMYGPDVSPITNSQVASRIGPTLVDLAIAIAAGGAGAFALSRPDVSDSLPGVAVAIALVPPLAVVGLMISQGSWEAATGALLLFVTNMVAIILFGGIVFILTGVVPVLRLANNTRWVRRSLGMVAVLGIGVVAVLGTTAETFRQQTVGLAKAETVVEAWIDGTDLTVQSSNYDGDGYQLVLTGSDEPPPIDELGSAMETALGEAIPISVTLVPTNTLDYSP